MDSTLLLISSSKSYNYTVGNKFGATVRDKNTHYNAVLVCNIAESMMHTPHPPSHMASFYGHPGKGRTEL